MSARRALLVLLLSWLEACTESNPGASQDLATGDNDMALGDRSGRLDIGNVKLDGKGKSDSSKLDGKRVDSKRPVDSRRVDSKRPVDSRRADSYRPKFDRPPLKPDTLPQANCGQISTCTWKCLNNCPSTDTTCMTGCAPNCSANACAGAVTPWDTLYQCGIDKCLTTCMLNHSGCEGCITSSCANEVATCNAQKC